MKDREINLNGSMTIEVRNDGTVRYRTPVGILKEDELLYLISERTYSRKRNQKLRKFYEYFLEQFRVIALFNKDPNLILEAFPQVCFKLEKFFCTLCP